MEQFFITTSRFGLFIIILSTIIFLAAIFCITRQILRYYLIELPAFEVLKKNAQQPNLQNNSISFIYQQLTNNLVSSIARTRVSNLFQMASKQQTISANQLAELDYLQENASLINNFIRFAKGILILLGLLGTFYGLSQMVGSIQHIFSTIETKNIQSLLQSYIAATQQMRQMFPYMETAFYTSFWGLSYMVLVRFALFPLEWLQQHFFSMLHQITNQALLPLLLPHTEQQYVVALVEQVSQNTKTINAITQKFELAIQQLSVDLQNLQQFSNEFKNGVQSFVQSQGACTQNIQALTAIVGNNADFFEQSGTVINALHQHNQRLEQISQKLYESDFYFADWVKETISITKQQQANFNESMKSLLELSRSNLTQANATFVRFGLNIQKFEKSLENLQNHLQYFSNTIDNASLKEINKLDELLQKFGNLSQNILEAQQQFSINYSNLNNNNTQTLTNKISDELLQKQINEIVESKIAKQLEESKNKIVILENELFEANTKQAQQNKPGLLKQLANYLGFNDNKHDN